MARDARPHYRSGATATGRSSRVGSGKHDRQADRYDLIILDDIAYVTKDQAETSVLFELIAARYERRSILITANQPFGEWGKIFPDQAMTLAAIDRLVHHATILEMNVESYRRREALDQSVVVAGPQPTRQSRKQKRLRLIDAPRQSKRLPRPAASVNYHSARPPRLIQMDAPFSSSLSRYTRQRPITKLLGCRPESAHPEVRRRMTTGWA